MTKKERFLKNIAQTSNHPFLLEIEKAQGMYIYDTTGKKYLDLIAGISVLNIGHCHPKVVEAIKTQADKYLHVMVYGEYLQSPQIDFAEAILKKLPTQLNNIYFTNSGTESIEAACKLAKRFTQRSEICYFKGSYHGSTQGSLSLYGSEYFKQNYRPLLPNTTQLIFNNFESINLVTEKTAGVVLEPIQAATGLTIANTEWLKALRQKCERVGALLIFDEIQSGFGRTGKLFAFEKLNVVPDVLCIAKAMGSGLPIGGLIANIETMKVFRDKPILGHITTFGGNPLICAAALAGLNVLINENLIEQVYEKEQLFLKLLKHHKIISVNSFGLWLSVEFSDFETCERVVKKCIEYGVIPFWFLIDTHKMRLAPPLIISKEEIIYACQIILKAIEKVA